MQTLNISKQFLQKPTPLPALPLSLEESLIACTIPSPGLGIILIFSDIAAPIPVNNTASSNTIICNTMLLCTDGISAENTFKKRVNTILTGICKASLIIYIPIYLASFLSVRYHTVCIIISIKTKIKYTIIVILAKLNPMI